MRLPLIRTKALVISAAFVAPLVALGIGQALARRRRPPHRRETRCEAPRFEVDPLWPKPLPNHWILGSTIGVWVDSDDHIWIIHRSSATLANNEKPLENKAGRMLRRRAAGSRVRPGGQPAAPLGRTGPGLRVARLEPRHLHRLQRQRLDRRQRRPRLAHPEVHQGRQVPAADRQEGRAPQGGRAAGAGEGEGAVANFVGGSNDQVSFGRVAKIFVDAQANEAYIADGYLNKRVAVARCRHRQDEAVLGRLRQQARRHAAPGL